MARIRIDELIMTSSLGRIILLLLLLRGRLAQLSLPDSQASRSKLDRVLRWYLRLLVSVEDDDGNVVNASLLDDIAKRQDVHAFCFLFISYISMSPAL